MRRMFSGKKGIPVPRSQNSLYWEIGQSAAGNEIPASVINQLDLSCRAYDRIIKVSRATDEIDWPDRI
ncbi:MAG: hypothetical protein JSU77_13585 [Fidelibacterota bacterium]|nr:MAG: hypothetical protein JSU77_13585 [Candidatus Neomarinimicrobiota bacterium]